MFIPKEKTNISVKRFSHFDALAIANYVQSITDWTCQIFAGMGVKYSVEVYNEDGDFIGHYI